MAGLKRILKMYGRMSVSDGKKTIHYVYDYAKDEATTAEEMPEGSERWLASERARRLELKTIRNSRTVITLY